MHLARGGIRWTPTFRPSWGFVQARSSDYVSSMFALLALMWSWPSHLILCFSLAFALVVITKANWFLQLCSFIAKSEDCSIIIICRFVLLLEAIEIRENFPPGKDPAYRLRADDINQSASKALTQFMGTAVPRDSHGSRLLRSEHLCRHSVRATIWGAVIHSSGLGTGRGSRELRPTKGSMRLFSLQV